MIILPDFQNLLHFLFLVRLRGNYHHPIKQINWDAVGTPIFGSANFSNSTISGHNQHWRHIIFQSTIQK